MFCLTEYRAIFWDFDGVIKDSVAVKTAAFRRLFGAYGEDAQNWVQNHHEAHGGVSRFVKIPFYYKKITGTNLTPLEVDIWCERFAHLVRDAVVESPWVPGAREYIAGNFDRQLFFLVTGTPQEEIEQILEKLDIGSFFRRVAGAPEEKKSALAGILASYELSPETCIMIGDSLTDYYAAEENGMPFLLRETAENHRLFVGIECARVKDFSGN